MLVTLRDILQMAEKGGYAVPAFNVYNMETVMGVIAAAEAEKSPVILQSYSRLFTNEEGYYVAPVALAAAHRASVPVCFHLDHGAGEKEVERALRYGATGIMIDASTLPLDENIAATRAVCERCAYVGIGVEGELGHIGSTKDEKCRTIPTLPRQPVTSGKRGSPPLPLWWARRTGATKKRRNWILTASAQ